VNKAHEALIVAKNGFTDACRRSVETVSQRRIALFDLSEFEDQFLGFRTIRMDTLNRVERVEVDLSIGGSPAPFFPLTCFSSELGKSQAIEVALGDWASEANSSNLLLLMGPFGSGKTASAVRFVRSLLEEFGSRRWRSPIYLDFREISELAAQSEGDRSLFATILKARYPTIPISTLPYLLGSNAQKRLVVIVDGYDEAALSGGDSPGPPDIRQLSPFFHPHSKILVACRRSRADSDERLLVDISSPIISSTLGIRNPTILTIEPWSSATVARAIETLPSPSSKAIGLYIIQSKIEYLRRPLLFRMLIQLDREDLARKEIVSLGHLYDAYFRLILTRDWASGASSISFEVKQSILTGIAEDLFRRSPTQESGLPVRSGFGSTRTQLELRVVQAVSDYHARVNATSKNSTTFPWTSDFLRTCHIISPVSGGAEGQELRYHFVHRSFYEYFLAQHLLKTIDRTGTLGLKGREVHEIEDLFDSLVLYFVKNGLTAERIAKLFRLGVSRQADRVELGVLIYLLEDHESLMDIIRNVPSDYANLIRNWERSTESHFLKKMYRYQMALITGDLEQAFSYIDYLRSRETDEEEDLELRLFSVGTNPADYLLRRLINPNLLAVRPITIYRLSKFGDTASIETLRNLRDHNTSSSNSGDSTKLLELLDDAISKIGARAS